MVMNMAKDYLLYYLIGINIVSFLLFTVDLFYHKATGKTLKPTWIFMVIVIIGGSLGVNIYFLIFYPVFIKSRRIAYNELRAERDYYHLWRIFALVMLIIHIVVCLFLYASPNGTAVRMGVFEAISNFAERSTALWIYLAIINAVTFIIFLIDKARAINEKWRIREIVLFVLSLAGGAVGGLLAMYIGRHKIRNQAFVIGLPMILLAHIVIIVYLIATTSA